MNIFKMFKRILAPSEPVEDPAKKERERIARIRPGNPRGDMCQQIDVDPFLIEYVEQQNRIKYPEVYKNEHKDDSS